MEKRLQYIAEDINALLDKTEIAVDVHAPQPTRVNIPSQCQDEFYETFDVKPSDGMWLDPEKRVRIW